MWQNSGMSEVFSTVLMIAVLVGGIGVLGVAYFSQPPPEKIPYINFRADSYKNDSGIMYLQLFHEGGDSLRMYNNEGKDAQYSSEFYLLINNDDKNWPIDDRNTSTNVSERDYNHFILIQSENLNYFDNGEILEAPVEDLPQLIQVVAKLKSGGEKIIWSGTVSEGANFIASERRICLNQSVTISDESNNHPAYWEWDFGDGTSKQYEQNPSHVYHNISSYTVILNTTTESGFKSSVTKKDYISVKYVHAGFSGSPRVVKEGPSMENVQFTDESICNPTSWHWNFGDGTTSDLQTPAPHVYVTKNDDVTYYTVSLTVTTSEGYSDTLTRENYIRVEPECMEPTANFGYTGRRDEVDNTLTLEFTDLSIGDPETINYWLWDFGDGKVSNDQNPTHDYVGTDFTVKLTVGNDCGKYNTTQRKIVFPCTNLTADVDVDPTTGPSPLVVNFTDHSEPRDIISSWRWSFGDGTYYSSNDYNTRNPSPHTYDRVGTFYVSLMVQNECGQAFFKTPIIVVSKPALISGYLWDDRDQDRTKNTGEGLLSGWKITLEERKNGQWTAVNNRTTDANGAYNFSLEGISNSVFRVREYLPNSNTWKTTYSYGTYNKQVSDSILIYDKRNYTDINFGNIGLHTSKISVPGKFYCYNGGWQDGWFYYSSLSSDAEFLDYNTSYNPTPRVVYMSPVNSQSGSMTPDPLGGYPNGYTNWGNSSFILTFREYNNYLKQVGVGAYYLDWWEYPIGTNYYNGKSFPVPDNTTISASQLKLNYKFNSSIHFDIDKPKEGSIIPYTSSYIVEAHFEGKGEQTGKCTLTTPLSGKLFYNSSVGEYLITDIDTRPYEGKRKLFTAKMELKTTPITYAYAFSNASVAYEPINVSITGITSEGVTWPSYIKGNTTVTASVNGKWQDNTSTVLYVDDVPVANMTVITAGLPSTLRGTFNAEQFAGQTLPIFVRVPYNSTHTDEIGPVRDIMGDYADSSSKNVTVLSKQPIKANFTAYPWSGKAPNEVAFTDLSTGGAKQWAWNFGDGNNSTLQDPIHIFYNEGNYTVGLTVTNATPMSDYIQKNITVLGKWHSTNLLTNRVCSLALSGMMNFICRSANSTITVNGTAYTFDNGDVVEIYLNTKQTSGKILLAGTITECNLTDISLFINNKYKDKGSITNIRVSDFENFHSNLTLTAENSYYAWISFQWDGVAKPISWKRNLIIEDLMPTTERFMSMELSPTQTFFDGIAGRYYFS